MKTNKISIIFTSLWIVSCASVVRNPVPEAAHLEVTVLWANSAGVLDVRLKFVSPVLHAVSRCVVSQVKCSPQPDRLTHCGIVFLPSDASSTASSLLRIGQTNATVLTPSGLQKGARSEQHGLLSHFPFPKGASHDTTAKTHD